MERQVLSGYLQQEPLNPIAAIEPDLESGLDQTEDEDHTQYNESDSASKGQAEAQTVSINEGQKSHIEKEKYESKVPAGRPGKDDDMAQAVLFFAANQYLNGQTVAVNGRYALAAGE
ncbi:hypothetical protein GL218_07490 [Daldinia childiae]|uniref:uncharacterized protein n=1 Tax=Daldinia childiae TaxID=326645 RepID=UPI0014458214|nr:uncharacterized protein GL218_07490 [Daldinia childiae]KAF3055213.1 hypothetical protein GL218_07490 [Daldinia childiae]